MAVWDAYRGGGLEETDGPVVPETSPFRPKPRRVPLPVADGDVRPSSPDPMGAAVGQAGGSDRV
jgi:hypothetical protein